MTTHPLRYPSDTACALPGCTCKVYYEGPDA